MPQAFTGTITPLLRSGVGGEVTLVFRMSNVNNNDQVDLGAVQSGLPIMSRIKTGAWLPDGDGGGDADAPLVGVALTAALSTLVAGTGGGLNKIQITKATLVNADVVVALNGHTNP